MASGPPGVADDSERHDLQERRATEAINAIFSGGDLADETLRLSNEFTDRHEARLRAWFTRRGRTSQ